MKENRDQGLLSPALQDEVLFQLLKSTGQAIIHFDAEANIIQLSPSEHKFLGYTANELTGMTLPQLFYPADEFDRWRSQLEKGNSSKEFHCLTRTGKLRLFRCAFTQIADGSGYCLLMPSTDTTRLKKELAHNMVLLDQTHTLNSLGTWEYLR